jgi:glycosyltransferase involved in cell wall biosynthesis
MEKITALICTFNEEANIAKCIESLKGVDEIIVDDGGSTDKTREIAKSLGAKVFLRKEWRDTRTKKDVQAFKDRFHWDPQFVPGKFYNGSTKWYHAVEHATNDFIFCPDADEIVTWDLAKLQEILPTADQVSCDFVHSHNPDGTPVRVAKITKLFRKSVTKFGGRAHECIIPYGRIVDAPFMRIDHWMDLTKNRSNVLPTLEYSVIKDNDLRSKFYLGREYYYWKEYKKGVQLLAEYLKDANWQIEIAQARLYKARCHWHLNEREQALHECFEAITLNPDFKEALELYSEMWYEPWKSKWKFIAANARNLDILF